MKKKTLAFLLVLMLLTSTAGAVDLYVDATKIETDTPPTIVDGRTLVPVRAIFEAIGATVTWDASTRTVTGVREDITVNIQIDNTTAYVNGEPRVLDVPAQLINDRTMVPARFIAESMGCEVTWDGKTNTVGVADKLKGVAFYATPTGEKYHYDSSCNGGSYYETSLAEINGRKLEPCNKCVDGPAANIFPGNVAQNPAQPSNSGIDSSIPTVSDENAVSSGNTDNGNNFNTYNNVDQQETDAKWALNIRSMKIHYPTCREVKKIAPQNYSTSNLSESDLKAQGYTTCGVCHK